MDPVDKTNCYFEMERLRSFLENNQLVQANAIVQKLEGIIIGILAKEAKDNAEGHPLWPAFRSTIRIKRDILSGKTVDSLAEMKKLLAIFVEYCAPK